MKRTTLWVAMSALAVLTACSAIALEYFYFDLCPFISCDPASRQFQAAFEWDNGIKSVGPVRSVGAPAEPDRRWRRLVRSTMLHDLPQKMKDQRIATAKGSLTLQFHGYGIVLHEELRISEPDFDSFWDASLRGDANTVTAMLGSSMARNVDACSRFDKISAISSAAVAGHSDVVKILAAHGANVNAVEGHGWTPLMLAAVEGHEETVKVLISRGAKVNALDPNGGTALGYAARARHTSIVKTLLASGASPNLQDELGRSALMYAAERGSAEVVQALLAGGADVTARDKNGDTALDIATREGYRGIAQALSSATDAH